MATITSSILALLAASPDASEPETIPVPSVTLASVRLTEQGQALTDFEQNALEPEPGADGDDPPSDDPLADDDGTSDEPYVDTYGAIPIIEMKNMAGIPVPTSRPTAFPQRPPVGLLGDTLNRRFRTTARGGMPLEADQSKWEFQFHGYLAAPLRIGYGARLTPTDPANPQQYARVSGQSKNSFHIPLVPDDQYLSWQYTTHNPRDWAEFYLSFGNGTVTGTTAIQGNSFTDANFKDQVQLGISQFFLTLTPTIKKARWARLLWRVGSFQNRYGASGRYDAGEIQTYLFGQTHVMGETGQLDILVKDFTVTLEHGIGVHRPDPGAPSVGTTFVHHAHAGFSYQNKLWFNLHWLNQFAREQPRLGIPDAMVGPQLVQRDGKMHVVGPELRIDWGKAGFWYAGFSYIKFKDALNIARGIEVVHASGVGEFTLGLNEIYFGGATNGNGEIYSAIFQHEGSVQKIRKGSAWYGQGADFVWKVFGMMNVTKTDDPSDAAQAFDGVWKVKYGLDLEYLPFAFFGVGLRGTQLRPNNRIEEQNYSIISPRLVFRTNFVTHETILLQYSRYIYNTRACDQAFQPRVERTQRCVQPSEVGPEGFGADPAAMDAGNRAVPVTENYNGGAGTIGQPDENVFMLMINMWF